MSTNHGKTTFHVGENQIRLKQIKYNKKKIGLALTSFTLAIAITPRRRQQNFYEGRAWRIPGIIVLGCAGGFSINDFSTRLNHKYQSDVYFEQMVARYNKK